MTPRIFSRSCRQGHAATVMAILRTR